MSVLRVSSAQERVHRSTNVRPIHRGVWRDGDESLDAHEGAMQAVRAALLAVPSGVLVDDWAAWLDTAGRLGPPRLPVRLGVGVASAVESRPGLLVRRSTFDDGDIAFTCGIAHTAATRTAVDVLCSARRIGRPRAVELVDQLLNLGLTTQDEIAARLAVSHQRGVVRARELLLETEPLAESGQETRLRLVIVDQGMPRPEAQWEVRDHEGRVVARCDMGYGELEMGVEYFGDFHKEQMAHDWDRQFQLNIRNVFIVVITAEHLRMPNVVGQRIRAGRLRQARLLDRPF